ncbi:hypothetical protein HMI54_013202 [Coelomomyces lativittatus]|nr:hypothetical protein HMI54_013202 [Coelomomyces lativittatus]
MTTDYEVIFASSQDPRFPANDILKSDPKLFWTSTGLYPQEIILQVPTELPTPPTSLQIKCFQGTPFFFFFFFFFIFFLVFYFKHSTALRWYFIHMAHLFIFLIWILNSIIHYKEKKKKKTNSTPRNELEVNVLPFFFFFCSYVKFLLNLLKDEIIY